MDNQRWRLILASFLKGSAEEKLEASKTWGVDKLVSNIGPASLEEAEKEALWEDSGKGTHLFYGDPDWPSTLMDGKYSPFFLCVVGNAKILNKRLCVGIVGTRSATGSAISSAVTLAANATLDGALTVSGFARGVDYASAWGSVFAEGPTLQVLPCGFLDSYSQRRLAFQKQMLSFGGALISPFHLCASAQAFRFYERNHLIALLCDVLVAIEAPIHSGTLITVGYALNLGREVLVHAVGTKDGKQREGTRRLAQEGAYIVNSWNDVLAVTGLSKSSQERLYVSNDCPDTSLKIKTDVFASQRYSIIER